MALHIHKYWLWLFGFGVLAMLIFVAYAERMPRPSTSALPTATVVIGGTTVVADVASTDQEREQGLSGRTSLPEGKGMLFVFNQPGIYPFWMKDMNFPIDIIWADADGTVIFIAPSLSPDTYPQAFGPHEPALSVLEVPAGFAARHGIALGSKIVVQ